MRTVWREIQVQKTAAKMANFRVDVLLKTLDELQKEKSQNEQILAEVSAKRKRLESEAASAMSKLTSVSERHARVVEKLKMEEQRVTQTQGQIEQFEQVNDQIRERLTQLNQQIRQNEEIKQSNLACFEERMSNLTEAFRSGWQNMEEASAVDNFAKQRMELTEEANSYEILARQLEELMDIEKAKHSTSTESPASVHEDVCKMFEAENAASKAALERQQQNNQLKTLERELNALLKEKEIYRHVPSPEP